MTLKATTYTNPTGVEFRLNDFGPDGQYNRYTAAHLPYEGKMGETFKIVLIAPTKRELWARMDAYTKREAA